MSPSEATRRSMGPKELAATFGAFVLIIGLPAALFWYSGRPTVALWLVGLFVAMVAVSAYALREVLRERERGD